MLKPSHLSSRKPRTTFCKLIAAGKFRISFTGFVAFGIFSLLTVALTSGGNAQRDPEFVSKTVNVEQDTTTFEGGIQTGAQDADLARALRDYEIVRLDGRAAAAKVRATGKLSLSTRRGTFDFQLEPHDLRAPGYTAQVIDANGVALKLPKTPVNTYKGIVDGAARAQVRMTVKENTIEGAIITEGERYFIQPARSLSKNAKDDEFVFYKGSDVIEAGACGVTLADEVEARTAAKLEGEGKLGVANLSNGLIPGLSPLRIVRLATDADAEYVAALGGASQANSQIMNIINLVDGIYQVEIGVTFQITFQNTWADVATDPYSATTPSTLLGQFRNHWNANFTHIERSLAHLWTGKDLDGGVIGIASLAVVCRNAQFAYGLSQRFPFSPSNPVTAQTVVLTAHEIGHNFSAYHPNDPDDVPADIEQPCDNTIMGAFIGEGSNFCPFSRSQIIGHATAYSSCLLDSSSVPPVTPCGVTPLGSTASGTLSASDCSAPTRGVRFLADQFSFEASAGQRIFITMDAGAGSIDPYLYLVGPDGYVVIQDDDSNGGTNARIPSTTWGTYFTLPQTGKYIIVATSFAAAQTGDYTINLSFAVCTLSVDPSSHHFPASGGNGVINVTMTGLSSSCATYQMVQYPGGGWLTPLNTIGNGSQVMSFTVQPNTNAAGRKTFMLIGPAGLYGGLRIPITQSGTGPDCSLTAIAPGQTVNGDLATSDCQSPVRGNGFYTDRYTFSAVAGQQVAITLSSSNAPATDTFLTLLGPNGVVILTDDDSGGLTNSRLPGGTGMLRLGLPGTYVIEVGTFESGGTGPYSLNLAATASGPSTLQFNQPAYDVLEGNDRVDLTVTRSGDTSGTATVNYATSDSAALTNCNVFNGIASSRCDYASSVGTVNFAAGEGSQSFSIPIVNDSFAEGSESFIVTLSSLTGSSLGSPVSATVTITDNDATTGANPITQTAFFVRQHYIDFLGREPDPAGFQGWQDIINNCPPGNITCDRVHVSGNFFQSQEFQQRGYFVYRFYPVAFGRKPDYAEFIPDIARVSGFLSDVQLEAARVAFVNDFMNRPAFITTYNGLNNTQFVDTLLATAAVAPHPTRDSWITSLGNGTKTRAQVLREIAESTQVYDKYYNQAFVVMQYFGYLRRDPDISYLTWIDELNNTGNARNMINGFVNSPEYTFRFGP